MADVAKRGFERFEAALLRGWNDGRPDRMTAFEAMGKAYLGFARDEPAYYAAMFESGIAPEADSELQLMSDRAFGVLRKATEELVGTLPRGERPPALMMSLHIFAMAHGIASLFARGDNARRKLPMTPEDLLEAAVLVYLRGLGFDKAVRA